MGLEGVLLQGKRVYPFPGVAGHDATSVICEGDAGDAVVSPGGVVKRRMA